MSNDSEYDYSEPWPLYADEEHPWKDYERLLKLEERMDTQYEMGDALGCTPATISYWLQKARDEHEPEHDESERECQYFEVCGNHTVGVQNGVCTVCLDLVRHNSAVGGPKPKTDLQQHMSELYDVYSDKAERLTQRRVEQSDNKDSEAEA